VPSSSFEPRCRSAPKAPESAVPELARADCCSTNSCLALLQQVHNAQADTLTVMLALRAAWGDVFSPSMQRKLDETIDANLRSVAAGHRFLQSVTLTDALVPDALPDPVSDSRSDLSPTPLGTASAASFSASALGGAAGGA